MTDLGRGEILGPFLLIGVLAALGAYFPRCWSFGVLAALLLIALYEAK